MIKACLFDLDGTLLDTLESIRYFLNKTLRKYSVREISSAETRLFVGNGAANLVRRAMRAGGLDASGADAALFETILDEYVDAYDGEPFYLTVPYRGIPEAIDRLYSAGIKLAVISNKPDQTVIQLCEKIFGDRFSAVRGARQGVPLKPDPCALFEICDLLGVDSKEVAYFGDTCTDMETGRRFGAALNVGVLWGFRGEDELRASGADRIISDPSEIAELVLSV